MLFSPWKKDIRQLKADINKLDSKIDQIHDALYIKNGNGYQGRLIVAEQQAANAISRTSAMWTVFTFAILAIGSVLGYQMYRIDCMANTLKEMLKSVFFLTGVY